MYIYGNKKHLYQWDLNQEVVVEDSAVKYVHFSDATTGNALVTEVVDGKANVPNILLQNAFDIKAYGFCGECVREEIVINVKSRVKPDDYIYTETEIKRYDDFEKDISDLQDKISVSDKNISSIAGRVGGVEEELVSNKDSITTLDNNFYKSLMKEKIVFSSSTDCSGILNIPHTVEMKIYYKNLLTYPYAFVSGQSYNGVTVTDEGDGVIYITGKATGGNAYIPLNNNVDFGTKDLQVLDADSGSNGDYKASRFVYYKAAGKWINIFVPQGTSVKWRIKPYFMKDGNITEERIIYNYSYNDGSGASSVGSHLIPSSAGTATYYFKAQPKATLNLRSKNPQYTEIEATYYKNVGTAIEEIEQAMSEIDVLNTDKFLTQDDVDEVIKKGIPLAATYFPTKEYAESTYAKKSDIPNVSEYATKGYVDAKMGDIDLGAYATEQFVYEQISGIDLGIYALKTDIPDVTKYQTAEQVAAAINQALGVIENGTY